MGSICSHARIVRSVQPHESRIKVVLNSDSQRTTTLSRAPLRYSDLLQQIAWKYNVPLQFLVLKTQKAEKEVCICDEESYRSVLNTAGGSLQITVFFPNRQALVHKSLERSGTLFGDRSTSTPVEKEGWGILRPIPIDVEVHSRSSVSVANNSSLCILKSEREPRTAQCFPGHLLLFDATTEDSFKYFGASIDEGSRAVYLPTGNIIVTGGKRSQTQALKLDLNGGTSVRATEMYQGRFNHASIWVQGCVWVIGGMNNQVLNHCEVFDGNKWKIVSALNVPRACPSASSWNNFVYVFGGIEESSIEKYEGEEWIELNVLLTQPLAMAGLYQEEEDTVIVAGGNYKNDIYEVVKISLGSGERECLVSLPVTDHFAGETVLYRDELYFQGALTTYVYEIAAGTWRCIK